MNDKLSHTDSAGKARMVNVGAKNNQKRVAKASGFIRLSPETIDLIRQNTMKKGEVLKVAEVAGIQAVKFTSSLIPLCHTIFQDRTQVTAQLMAEGVSVTSEVHCTGKTGVEMEALTAVSVALLTVYDMCKAVDKAMVMEQIYLVEKTKTELKKI